MDNDSDLKGGSESSSDEAKAVKEYYNSSEMW